MSSVLRQIGLRKVLLQYHHSYITRILSTRPLAVEDLPATKHLPRVETTIKSTKSKQFDAIPGPHRLPFIGSLLPYKLGLKKVDFYHEHLREMYDKYGPIVREDQGSTTIIHVFTPEDIGAVYKSTSVPHIAPLLQTAADYKAQNALKPGLGNSNGPEWQRLRNAVNKFTLRPKAANSHIVKQDSVALKVIERLEQHLMKKDGSVPGLEDLIDCWITDSLGLVVTNTTNDNKAAEGRCKQDDFSLRLAATNRRIFHLSAHLKMSTGLYQHFMTPKARELHRLETSFYGDLLLMCNRLIEMKSACKMSQQEDGSNNMDDSIVYSLLNDEQLDKENIIAVTTSLLTDGYSTTAPTLLGALHCLALAPEVQEDLFQEAQQHCPPGLPITSDTLNNTYKIRAFIKEALRLYPIGDGVQRLLMTDMELSGYHLPKGTRLDLNPYIWLRDPAVFPDPQRVMLERWYKPPYQAGVTERFHPMINTPFSTGVRTCVGRRLAEHDLSVFVLRLVQRMRVSLATPTPARQVYRVLLRPHGPIPLRFQPRN